MFPLAISAVNGKPSEISLYVLSSEPLMSRAIFEKRLDAYRRGKAEWIRGRPERQRGREAEMRRLLDGRIHAVGRRNDPDTQAGDPQPEPAVLRHWLGTEPPHRQFRESDDEYWGRGDLLRSMEVEPKVLGTTASELPRLKGKSWWLTKQVQTFAVKEMRDLEFEPAVPILMSTLRTQDHPGPASCLAQFGPRVRPFVLGGLQSTNGSERRLALLILVRMGEGAQRMLQSIPDQEGGSIPGHSVRIAPLLKTLSDDDPSIRQKGCEAVALNWDPLFATRLTEMLRDSDGEVRSAAGHCLRQHWSDLRAEAACLQRDGG